MWQFALLPHAPTSNTTSPPQSMQNGMNPMFGHSQYLTPESYIRRPNYGEQGMVDVPHVTPQQHDILNAIAISSIPPANVQSNSVGNGQNSQDLEMEHHAANASPNYH